MPKIQVNGGREHDYDKDPDHCPICHHGIKAVHISSNVVQRSGSKGDLLQILYRCPRDDCQMAFIGTYRQNYASRTRYPEGPFILRNTAPHYAKEPDIPREIKQLSPGFVEVYSQSASAETYQLDQIAGVGYRKSLEYLIKDYALLKNPDKEEEIKGSYLGGCIENYVDGENIKSCAKRAAWLGNDETHYVRKWEEKDIEDLKVLIQLTQAWILNNLLTDKYLDEMR